MKTAMVSGARENLELKTSTGVYTQCKNKTTGRVAMHGANIYSVVTDPSALVLVATRTGGGEMKDTKKVITSSQWDELDALRNPYNDMDFHLAVMRELDFDA